MNREELEEGLARKGMADSLTDLVAIFNRIMSRTFSCSEEMKKAVQNSIKELCTAISNSL